MEKKFKMQPCLRNKIQEESPCYIQLLRISNCYTLFTRTVGGRKLLKNHKDVCSTAETTFFSFFLWEMELFINFCWSQNPISHSVAGVTILWVFAQCFPTAFYLPWGKTKSLNVLLLISVKPRSALQFVSVNRSTHESLQTNEEEKNKPYMWIF